jgi:hypothetical protein
MYSNRVTGITSVRVVDLIANELNPYIHPANQAEAMTESFETLGVVEPIIVNSRNNHIVDGHLRVDLARQYGVMELAAYVIELSEEEERIAIASLDPISELATTSKQKLAAVVDVLTARSLNHVAGLVERFGLRNESPSLESLRDKYGGTKAEDFYPVIRFTLSEDDAGIFSGLLQRMNGENESAKLLSLLRAYQG